VPVVSLLFPLFFLMPLLALEGPPPLRDLCFFLFAPFSVSRVPLFCSCLRGFPVVPSLIEVFLFLYGSFVG